VRFVIKTEDDLCRMEKHLGGPFIPGIRERFLESIRSGQSVTLEAEQFKLTDRGREMIAELRGQ